jgi:hypothetical protein
MPYIYYLRVDSIPDGDRAVRTVYGIDAYDEESGEMLEISDVFSDRDAAVGFVERCNDLQLSIIHLREAIEDALE